MMYDNIVLFIEDNVLCSLDTCDYLRQEGFHVVPVYCAAAAFEAIAWRRPLLALVTDIDLGPGADGFEIARRARAAYPELPVVYISGAAAARHPAEGVEGSQFIGKPFRPQQLAEALRRAIPLEAA